MVSSVKEHMLSNHGLKIAFSCPECDEPIEDFIEDASFDWTTERMSDGIGTTETTVTCSGCQTPYTLILVADAGEKSVYIPGLPDVKVRFHDDTYEHDYDNDYEEFLAEYDPPEPYAVYEHSVGELRDLDHGSEIYSSAQNAFLKMLYLQYVVVLEAYLSDRLIRLVMDDDKKLLALVGATPALRDKAPKLIEVVKDPDYVAKVTKAHLQGFSFHNLEEVAKFYKAVLKVNLLGDEANEEKLKQVIQVRHHLVHRSGRDKDGKVIPVNSLAVQQVKGLIDDVVKRVEEAYAAYMTEKSRQRLAEDDIPW